MTEANGGVEQEIIPQDILDTANSALYDSLSTKSDSIYEKVYEEFLTWMQKKKTNSYSEVVLIAYFKECSATVLPSTLWAKYSMLKLMIKNKRDIDISVYNGLRGFLKSKNVGFKPKKSKVFAPEEIRRFLEEAPDAKFLDVKVAVILGITGACRRDELYKMTTDDIVDENSYLKIIVPITKTKIVRKFVVENPQRLKILQYMQLRPKDCDSKKLFLNYQKQKCTRQTMGINKLGTMPTKVAEWLGLPETKLYTGHSFRRTSATILADAGASITTLKRHGGWRSTQTVEGYIEDSVNNKRKICHEITKSFTDNSVSSFDDSNDAIPTEINNNDIMVNETNSSTSKVNNKRKICHEITKSFTEDSVSSFEDSNDEIPTKITKKDIAVNETNSSAKTVNNNSLNLQVQQCSIQ